MYDNISYMANESQNNEPRFWEKWKKAGAVGGADEAKIEAVRAKGPIKVAAVAEHFAGVAAGDSVLSLGEKIVNQGPGWEVTKPEVAVVVKGHGYELGKKITIPRKAKPVSRVFGQQ